jgi:hypothetical protein
MTPATVTLRVWRNARYIEEFPFTAPADGDDAAPYDLTGWTGRLQVRLYGAAAGAALLSLASQVSDGEGVWIIEPASGIVRVRIDEDSLTALWDGLLPDPAVAEPGDPITLKYDLVMTPPVGGDEVWMQGDFIIEPGVTA